MALMPFTILLQLHHRNEPEHWSADDERPLTHAEAQERFNFLNAHSIAQRRSNYVLYAFIAIALTLVAWRLGYDNSQTSKIGQTTRVLVQKANVLSHKANALSTTTSRIVLEHRTQRLQALYETCQHVNELSRKLSSLIISSTLETKGPVSTELQNLGFPDFATRLREARKEAAGLNLPDCQQIKNPASQQTKKP